MKETQYTFQVGNLRPQGLWFKEEKQLPRSDVLPPKRRGSHAEAVVKRAPEPRDGSQGDHRQKHVHVHVDRLVNLQCEEPWCMS